MNLYRLTQQEARGYDTYDSCIVAAESEEDARIITPNYDGKFQELDYPYACWATHPDRVRATLIGVAEPEIERGIVLASFNAG